MLNALWVKADDLKVGEKLRGRCGETLFVTKVEPVEFKEDQDFYEISLKYHHMYYLVDTAGNHILTHNLVFALLVGAAVGFVVGSGVGAGSVWIYKKYKGEEATKKELITGAIYGGVAGAVIGVSVVVGLNWAEIAESTSEFIKNHESVATALEKSKDWIKENGKKCVVVVAASVEGVFLIKAKNKKDVADYIII